MNFAKHIKRLVLFFIILIIVVFGLVLLRQYIIDKEINDDISNVFKDEKYHTPVAVMGVPVIKQNYSCGYAVLEMFGKWCSTDITEESLYEQHMKKIVTATGKSFSEEMNKQFPKFSTTMLKNCRNTELIDSIYNSLKDGVPVPFEFAAIYHGADKAVWTLHYSIVVSMDVPNDEIVVSNPYGYEETYTISDFLKATRYDSYENMPFYYKLGFAIGIFEKNTVFIAKDKEK